MFKVIENARMFVGTKAIATLSTGYLNALEYAKQRVQGADLTQMTDKAAPARHHHAPPRRAPLADAAEGLCRGPARARHLHREPAGHRRPGPAGDPAAPLEPGSDAELANRVSDLLLPLVKGLGSERAWVLLGTESLQTFGGSGFLQDYPIEQYVRDAKIDTLYEGTTAIQGLDFFFRKIVRDKGQALQHVAGQMQEFAKDLGGSLDTERELLGKALEDVQGILGHMIGDLMKSDPRMGGDVTNLYKVGQNTTRLLLAAGDLVVGWLLLRQAEVAQRRLDGGAVGQGRRLLPRQGRGGLVLRQERPAQAGRRARHRRGHRQRPHGRARVRLLVVLLLAAPAQQSRHVRRQSSHDRGQREQHETGREAPHRQGGRGGGRQGDRDAGRGIHHARLSPGADEDPREHRAESEPDRRGSEGQQALLDPDHPQDVGPRATPDPQRRELSKARTHAPSRNRADDDQGKD